MVYTYVRADGGGGSTSTGRPQFERHYPSATTVEGDATTVRNTADAFETLSDDVVSKHNEAKSNVEGDPRSGMDGATSEAKTKSTNLYRRAIVAGGALQVYSGAIEAFNDSVDGWNRKINAADDDEKAEKIYANHTGDYTAAVETLEDAATTGKSQLTKWDDDKTVKNLWAAGALPSSATAMLPGIGLEYSDLTGLPPDLAALSDKELAKKLQNDPQLRNNEDVMADVADRIDAYDPDDASADASQLADGNAETAGKLALLNVYGEYAQEHDKTIPVNAAKYLRNIVGELFPGDDNSYRHTLPEATATQEALDDASIGNWTTGMLANSLLLASDGRLDPTPHHGPARPILGSSAVPKAVTDALHDTPSPTFGRAPTGSISGGDGYVELANLLADADEGISPGVGFSEDITNTTADWIADMRHWSEDGYEGGAYTRSVRDDSIERYLNSNTSSMQDMLSVATRNENANSNLLSSAANDSGPNAQRLADLLTFSWDDDGEAVSGYTDWIADYNASDDPHDVTMADTAAANLFDVTTSRSITLDNGHTFVESMMKDAGDPDSRHSIGEENPAITRSLGQIANSYLDDLAAGNPDSDETGVAPDGDGIDVVMADRSRLFTVIASDDHAADILEQNAGVYTQDNLDAAVRNSDDPVNALGSAVAKNTRLDGLLSAGRFNADGLLDSNEYQDQNDAYKDTLRNAAIGRTIIQDVGSPIPYVGGFTTGAGDVYESIVASSADRPDVDFDPRDGNMRDEEAQEMRAANELYNALQRNEGELSEPADSMLQQMNGGDEPWPVLNGGEKREVLRELDGDHPMYDQYFKDNNTENRFDNAAMDLLAGDSNEVADHNKAAADNFYHNKN